MTSPITPETAILLALRQGAAYGLELIERVKFLTLGRVELQQGTLYPQLHMLETENYIVVCGNNDGVSVPARGGRPRRYYKLTEKGVEKVRSYCEVLHRLISVEDHDAKHD